MRSLPGRNSAAAGAVVVGTTAIGHSVWPIVGAALALIGLALVIIACAAFSSRSAPMARIRALVRDIRGDRRTSR